MPSVIEKWLFPVENNNSFIRSIVNGELLFGADMSLFGELIDDSQTQYYWTSQHLNDVRDDSELIARASALKIIFHGMMHIYFPFKYKRLNLDLAQKFENGIFQRSCNIDKIILPPYPFSFALMHEKFSLKNNLVHGDLDKVVFSSRYSDTMRKMLMYAGFNGLSYVSVYGLLDWVKYEAQQRGLESTHFLKISKTQLNNLTATCNEPFLSGVMSRHGGPGNVNTPGHKYVSIDDAINIVCQGCRELFSEIMKEIDVEKKIEDLLIK